MKKKITIENYQEEAMKFLIPSCENWEYANWGLLGELGEVASLIAKSKRKGIKVDKEKLKLEIGDCFWFIALKSYLSHIDNPKKFYKNTFSVIIEEEVYEIIHDWGHEYSFIVDLNIEGRYGDGYGANIVLSTMYKNGLEIEDCLQANIDKLSGRLERGTIIGDGDYR